MLHQALDSRIFPQKLKSGDLVRVVAPSMSHAIISPECREIAAASFAKLGLRLSFGEHVEEIDHFSSSPVKSRVADLHAAFADPEVKAILTVIGGHNCNQLLAHLDYNLIRANSKVFCGYSDTTVLGNAIYAKTGLVNYSGPAYSTFGIQKGNEYTHEYFYKCLFNAAGFDVESSSVWSDDAWYLDQDKRDFLDNIGPVSIQSGRATGRLIGGNLCSLNLLQGTPYMPSLKDSLLFLEDDAVAGDLSAQDFDRNLQSILHLPEAVGIRGVLIGRFQKASKMNPEIVAEVIASKLELQGLPVAYGFDFGHTQPYLTLPIGGDAELITSTDRVNLRIISH